MLTDGWADSGRAPNLRSRCQTSLRDEGVPHPSYAAQGKLLRRFGMVFERQSGVRHFVQVDLQNRALSDDTAYLTNRDSAGVLGVVPDSDCRGHDLAREFFISCVPINLYVRPNLWLRRRRTTVEPSTIIAIK